MKKKTIVIEGYSIGDTSVGIPSCDFSFNTGWAELTNDDIEFIEEHIIMAIWELHDNGDLHYTYSCDDKGENNEMVRVFNTDTIKAIENKKTLKEIEK